MQILSTKKTNQTQPNEKTSVYVLLLILKQTLFITVDFNNNNIVMHVCRRKKWCETIEEAEVYEV